MASLQRQKYLTEQWLRYPAAPVGCVAVAVANAAADFAGWLAGRAHSVGPSGLVLNSGGVSKSLRFHASCRWLNAGDFDPSVLVAGDLLAVRVSAQEVREVVLLAPCLQSAPPTKLTMARAMQWQKFIRVVRDFFWAREFCEVPTPTLVICPGSEPHLDPFFTEWNNGNECRALSLPTSPEWHLKKLLAADFPRVFEARPCFRNGELSAHHQPEFWMLEWYRAFASLDHLTQDVRELVSAVAAAFAKPVAVESFANISMAALVQQHAGFALNARTSQQDLVAECQRRGWRVASDEPWDDLFFRLFVQEVEPRLQQYPGLFLTDYPPQLAALARVGGAGWAQRFEFYLDGVEIANAFHELNDPEESRQRFIGDVEKKRELGKRPIERDEGFDLALMHGMPPAAGIALGLDRLFMWAINETDIAKTRAFPFQAPSRPDGTTSRPC